MSRITSRSTGVWGRSRLPRAVRGREGAGHPHRAGRRVFAYRAHSSISTSTSVPFPRRVPGKGLALRLLVHVPEVARRLRLLGGGRTLPTCARWMRATSTSSSAGGRRGRTLAARGRERLAAGCGRRAADAVPPDAPERVKREDPDAALTAKSGRTLPTRRPTARNAPTARRHAGQRDELPLRDALISFMNGEITALQFTRRVSHLQEAYQRNSLLADEPDRQP
jgi:hypothetical protein